jgi:hypothetical protein
MKKRRHSWNKRKRTVPFNPDRRYLDRAVTEFLAAGGRISTLVLDEKSYQLFVEGSNGLRDADEFLLDQ